MLFKTLLASVIALGMGVSAAPAPSADPRYVQLRVFGESGCSALNEGELGVYGDHLNKCQTFKGITIKSVSYEYKYFDDCIVTIYEDDACELNPHDIEVKTCLTGNKEYSSYKVQCTPA
ncbi:hypothetical protein BDV26DRAFT_297600 [Aspergillus bertholletiae]|uniref:Uncharacterized protein n=1 Tax=Aspergillus bertholletiae TaxID=1226010 RepID=A0A5N7AS97_9EURO|nr:hypothetical protein BDV26DRAFT_297600 [Aspergillus bertholletiae]